VIEDLIAVGKIIKCFGIKGEVCIESLTFSVERFFNLVDVYLGLNDKSVIKKTVSSVKINNKSIIFKFDSCSTRKDAEDLIGYYVFVDSKQKIKLPKGKYFIHDLIGLTLKDTAGNLYGILKDVLILPANNVYVVDYKDKEVLIPAIDEFIKNVDLNSKTITISLIDGLFND